MCQRLVLYQTVLSETPEMRSLKPRLDRGEARALSFSKEVVGLFGLYSRSLLTMLDRGEARALSFSKECQSLWLYLPIDSLCRDGRVMVVGRQLQPQALTFCTE